MRCKNRTERCKNDATEESGYCFGCAENIAWLLHNEGFDAKSVERLAYGYGSES